MSDAASNHAIAEALRRLEPLREVPEGAIRELLELTTVVRFEANQRLFEQGDALDDYAWLLLSGRMSVRVTSGAEKRVMADVWPGEIVGEAALYARGRARSATVVTTMPSTVLRIPRSVLDHDDQPALIALELHLLETMAKRLRSTNTVLQRVVAEQRTLAAAAPKPPASPAGPRTGPPPPANAPARASRPPTPAAPERLTLAQRLARWFQKAD